MKRLTSLTLLCLAFLTIFGSEADSVRTHFYTLNTKDGLSDNTVLQMLQLRDGRMVIATERGINVYDRTAFAFLPIGDADRIDIEGYEGQMHLYVDAKDRLWVKTLSKVCCIDLRTFTVMRQPLRSLTAGDNVGEVTDLFVDDDGEVWAVSGQSIAREGQTQNIALPTEAGDLQDLVTFGNQLFLFFGKGEVYVYDKQTLHQAYHASAYPPEQQEQWKNTSLVKKDDQGRMYQIRTGRESSIFTIFNPQTKTFRTRYTCPGRLHTLTVSSSGQVIISSPQGYMVFPVEESTAAPHFISQLNLPDGTSLSTGVNTIYCDRQGGIWLGTYRKGLLYTSPHLGLFDNAPVHIDLCPILTKIFVGGEPIQQGQSYGGRVTQPRTAAYTDSFTLAWDQHDVAFQFCTMNYVAPRSTKYRYRLNGQPWQTATAGTESMQVDSNGSLYLSFKGLSAGDYNLEVKATSGDEEWNTESRKVYFHIEASPWLGWKACLWYACVLLAVVAAIVRQTRRNRRRRVNERALMRYIEELRRRCNELEASQTDIPAPTEECTEQPKADEPEPAPTMNSTDQLFLKRAIEQVEAHLADPAYGVEQLAKDLCMERTGLYKKLKAINGVSPVTLVRSVRLQRARELMDGGHLSLTDIAYQTGFSSASYFTKCFKAEYGTTPSDYLQELRRRKQEA